MQIELGDFIDWQYIGNNKNESTYHKLEMFCVREKIKIPNSVKKCLCYKKIKYNYYIYNINKNIVKIIGSTCYKKFTAKHIINKRCLNCCNLHSNEKNDFCDICQEKVVELSISYDESYMIKKCMKKKMRFDRISNMWITLRKNQKINDKYGAYFFNIPYIEDSTLRYKIINRIKILGGIFSYKKKMWHCKISNKKLINKKLIKHFNNK